jgi:hypothetical protein
MLILGYSCDSRAKVFDTEITEVHPRRWPHKAQEAQNGGVPIIQFKKLVFNETDGSL